MIRQDVIVWTLLAATLFPGIIAEEYHCGMGTVTKAWSQICAYVCDSSLFSEQCCLPHDRCYNKIGKYGSTMTHAVCDIKFKHCINQHYRGRFFCRPWLVATHYSPLIVSSFFRQYF